MVQFAGSRLCFFPLYTTLAIYYGVTRCMFSVIYRDGAITYIWELDIGSTQHELQYLFSAGLSGGHVYKASLRRH